MRLPNYFSMNHAGPLLAPPLPERKRLIRNLKFFSIATCYYAALAAEPWAIAGGPFRGVTGTAADQLPQAGQFGGQGAES
jgi:hypothetical protein